MALAVGRRARPGDGGRHVGHARGADPHGAAERAPAAVRPHVPALRGAHAAALHAHGRAAAGQDGRPAAGAPHERHEHRRRPGAHRPRAAHRPRRATGAARWPRSPTAAARSPRRRPRCSTRSASRRRRSPTSSSTRSPRCCERCATTPTSAVRLPRRGPDPPAPAGPPGTASPRHATCWSGRDRTSFSRVQRLRASSASRSSTASGTPRRAAAATQPVAPPRRRVAPQQRVARPERVVERAPVAQPEMRRAAARHGRGREVVHRVGGRRLAVVGDDRRGVVEVAEVQPAAAVLLHVQVVGGPADPRAHRVALRPRRLDVVRHGAALRGERQRVVHGEARDLLGDRQALGLVGVEDRGRAPSRCSTPASSQARFVASAMPAFMP